MGEEHFMKIAIEEAKNALLNNEVPIGAVIVCDGNVIAKAHNEVEAEKDVTAHAEIIAIKKASRILDGWRLNNCEIYVTCEPCAMCAGAIMNARLRKVVYGAKQIKFGTISTGSNILNNKNLNHKLEIVGGVCQKESIELLKRFFSIRRDG